MTITITAKHKNILKTFINGSMRLAEFAITNECIAKCSFCDIWKQRPRQYVDREKGLLAIDKLADLGVAHITLTGGEPLLHPNVIDFAKKCTSRNIHSAVLDAAPSLITESILDGLDEARTDMLSIRLIPMILRSVKSPDEFPISYPTSKTRCRG